MSLHPHQQEVGTFQLERQVGVLRTRLHMRFSYDLRILSES